MVTQEQISTERRMIFPPSIVEERFDETFIEVPSAEFLGAIVEAGRITATHGKQTEKYPSDTDHVFEREFAVPIKGSETDYYKCTITLFRDIHESGIIMERIGLSPTSYDSRIAFSPNVTLKYNNGNKSVSVEVNPQIVKEAETFEEPVDKELSEGQDGKTPEEQRETYLVRNTDGDSLEISGSPDSFGANTHAFLEGFSKTSLETFQKEADKSIPDGKSNQPFLRKKTDFTS